ncbi:MAG: redox-regulated ATPase YchF [Candidatus Brocadiae bacterium]|nr:redox-regulated ATPase YchF [Candidatus Brocadiia bacterium]
MPRIALIGTPQTGKTTLWCALTGADYQTALQQAGQAGGKARVGISKIEDARLSRLSAHFRPKKHTPAVAEFADSTAIQLTSEGREKNGVILANLRNETDGLCLVVPAWKPENPSVLRTEAEIKAEIEAIATEFVFADLAIAETRIEKLKVQVTKPTPTRERDQKELDVLKVLHAAFSEGKPAAGVALKGEDAKLVKGFRFLSEKPLVVALNLPETAVGKAPSVGGYSVVPICAKLELELLGMEAEERAAFMGDYGLTELATPALVQACFRSLGLQYFFTAGEDECRAWIIRKGDDAVEAASKIHSDLARGFVAAEVVSFADWEAAAGDMKVVKARARLRQEGKGYIVADGDIVNIKSGV